MVPVLHQTSDPNKYWGIGKGVIPDMFSNISYASQLRTFCMKKTSTFLTEIKLNLHFCNMP